MQKITKGAIAAGAAALLLVGGGGTFMAWNQDGPVTAEAITAGSLTLDATTATPVWTLNGETVDVATARIVPGDVLKFSHDVRINAVGNNIQGTLSITPGTIAPATPGDGEDIALAGFLNTDGATSFAFEEVSEGLVDNKGVASFADEGEYNATLTATFDFGYETAQNLVAQGGAVNLSALQLSLEQTDASPESVTPEAPEDGEPTV